MPLRVMHIASDVELSDGWKQMRLVTESMRRAAVHCRVLQLTDTISRQFVFRDSCLPRPAGLCQPIRMRENGVSTFLSMSRIWRTIRKWQPQVIHFWQSGRQAETPINVLGATRIPLVFSGFEADWRTLAWWRMQRLLKSPVRVVLPTHASQDALGKYSSCTVPMAVAAPQPLPRDKWKQFCSACQVPHDAKVIGAITNDHPEALRHLVWSAELIKVVRDDTHLILFCQRKSRRLEEFRDRIEIADRVHLMNLPAESGVIMPYFDVFWSPTTSAGQASLLLEAAAAGVPAVAPDTLVNRKLLGEHAARRLFRRANVASIASITLRALGEHGPARDDGSRILQQYQPQDACNHYLRIYREITQSR